MSAERKILSYLEAYGNTRETDLINYAVQNFHKPHEKVKKVVDRLAIRGKVHRVVHNKLKPPEVYITLEEPLPRGILVERELVNEEVDKILEEAASLAERINDKRQHCARDGQHRGRRNLRRYIPERHSCHSPSIREPRLRIARAR
jgi:hypothetical protein